MVANQSTKYYEYDFQAGNLISTPPSKECKFTHSPVVGFVGFFFLRELPGVEFNHHTCACRDVEVPTYLLSLHVLVCLKVAGSLQKFQGSRGAEKK